MMPLSGNVGVNWVVCTSIAYRRKCMRRRALGQKLVSWIVENHLSSGNVAGNENREEAGL